MMSWFHPLCCLMVLVGLPVPVLSHRVFYSKDSVMGDPVNADIFRNLLGKTLLLGGHHYPLITSQPLVPTHSLFHTTHFPMTDSTFPTHLTPLPFPLTIPLSSSYPSPCPSSRHQCLLQLAQWWFVYPGLSLQTPSSSAPPHMSWCIDTGE